MLDQVLLRVEPPPAHRALEAGPRVLPGDRHLVVVRRDGLLAVEHLAADRTAHLHGSLRTRTLPARTVSGTPAGAADPSSARPPLYPGTMPLYRSSSEPSEPLVAPAIVAAFDGWIDAAGASTV